MGFYPLVDRSHRFIVFWNAKCGCTSVKHMFLGIVVSEGFADRLVATRQIHQFIGYGDGPYSCAKSDLTDQFGDYYKWIVTRNPWRRVASFFLNKSPNGGNSEVDVGKTLDSRDMTFRGLVRSMLGIRADKLQHHLEPQVLGLEGVEFDRVVELELADEGMAEVARELDIEDLQLPKINVMRDRRKESQSWGDAVEFFGDIPAMEFRGKSLPDWRALYDDELVEMVRDIYADDVARFDFRFGGGA